MSFLCLSWFQVWSCSFTIKLLQEADAACLKLRMTEAKAADFAFADAWNQCICFFKNIFSSFQMASFLLNCLERCEGLAWLDWTQQVSFWGDKQASDALIAMVTTWQHVPVITGALAQRWSKDGRAFAKQLALTAVLPLGRALSADVTVVTPLNHDGVPHALAAGGRWSRVQLSPSATRRVWVASPQLREAEPQSTPMAWSLVRGKKGKHN
jgi:hypothetical protein